MIDQTRDWLSRIRRFKFFSRRKYLLFSSIDTNRAAYRYWLGGGDRSFDVALYVYRGECPDIKVEYCEKRSDFKFPNFYAFSQKINILRYAAVLLIDDDIQITTPRLNELFKLFSDNGLLLAQPAYDRESASSWDISFVDEEFYLRYTNFVENGVALMSRAALKKCLVSFRLIKSGWGADFVWPFLLNFPPNKIAVIDAVQCHHPRSPSALNKVMPRQLHRWEGEFMMSQFGAHYFTPRVLGGKPVAPLETTPCASELTVSMEGGGRLSRGSRTEVQSVAKPLQKHLDRGRNYLKYEKFELAERNFEEAIRRWPEHPLPYIEYAKAAFAQRDYQECITRWNAVIEKFSAIREAIIAMGAAQMELGKHEEADRLLSELHEREKGEVEKLRTLLGQAREHISAERYAKAAQLYGHAENIWPHRLAPFMHHHRLLEHIRRTRHSDPRK